MPPVVRLELRWENEFGMPSTHCMMALALPLSLIIYTYNKPYWTSCLVLGVLAFLLVTTCRLYLGMHTLLDLLAGISLSSFILVATIPLGTYITINLQIFKGRMFSANQFISEFALGIQLVKV